MACSKHTGLIPQQLACVATAQRPATGSTKGACQAHNKHSCECPYGVTRPWPTQLPHRAQGGAPMASNAHHVGSLVWVPEKGVDGTLFRSKKVARWVRGRVAALRPGADGQLQLEVATEEGAVHVLPPGEAPLQNERDDTVDDLVKSDFLHEPGCGRRGWPWLPSTSVLTACSGQGAPEGCSGAACWREWPGGAMHAIWWAHAARQIVI